MGRYSKINESIIIWHVSWVKFITTDVVHVANKCIFFFTEIAKVRASLFQINGVKKEPLVLPEPEGVVTTLTEKVYVPVKEHPDVSNCVISTLAFDSRVYL